MKTCGADIVRVRKEVAEAFRCDTCERRLQRMPFFKPTYKHQMLHLVYKYTILNEKDTMYATPMKKYANQNTKYANPNTKYESKEFTNQNNNQCLDT